MTDRTFLQCQAFELRRLLVECGEDPVLAPQFQDRLREVEERLAQPEEEPRPDCYRWRLLAKSSDHKRQLGLETEEYQAGKERGERALPPLLFRACGWTNSSSRTGSTSRRRTPNRGGTLSGSGT
jgi:hypothetical protein